MSEIEEVQEQMKADMEAINEQMATMMEAMIRQGGETLGSTGGPYFVQDQNRHSFPPYGLPPNYTPPNVAHAPDENVNNSTPILIESQQSQSGQAQVSQPMGEAHEVP
ncbi:hypothetical protein HKD37_01G001388 [Glycine soja]